MIAMGWCQEFGVQIEDECDHLMVASYDSCSCAECGVVCRGKFPGCATVWAAGPVAVGILRPVKEIGIGLGHGQGHIHPDASPTNGKVTPGQEITARSTPAPTTDVLGMMQSVRSEIQMLNRKLDRAQERAEASEEAAKAASQAAAELSQRIGRALSVALQQQHTAILGDLAGLRQQITADVGQLGDVRWATSAAALRADIVGQVDARFEWLVNELSNRLVLLGNEVARINEQPSVAAPLRATADARSDRRFAL